MSGCIPVAFLSVCVSKEIPGCHEAFAQKQHYLGDFRRGWEGVLGYGSLGEERQSFGMNMHEYAD